MNFHSVSFVCMPSSRMRLSCYIIFCTSLNPIFFSFLNFCSIKRSLIILSKKIILAHFNIFLALVKKLEQNKDRALFTYVWAKFVLALQASSSLSLSLPSVFFLTGRVLSPSCCVAPRAQASPASARSRRTSAGKKAPRDLFYFKAPREGKKTHLKERARR